MSNQIYFTCRFGTSAIFFSSANSQVSDDNARELLVGLILALDYTYSRDLNIFQGYPYIWSTTVLHDYFPQGCPGKPGETGGAAEGETG